MVVATCMLATWKRKTINSSQDFLREVMSSV
jgi:hypothetical protein